MDRPAFLLALAAAAAAPAPALADIAWRPGSATPVAPDSVTRAAPESATLAAPAGGGAVPGGPTSLPFAAEERRGRGRLGVAAIDLRDGRRLGQRGTERFPMASTFKLPLVVSVLARVDRGAERLDRSIRFTPRDLLPNSPVVARQTRGGSLTVAALCAAAIEYSDNAAANLLLRTVGGPPGVTAYLRGLGDTVTRLDRTEPALNEATPGDPRDTTTPDAMAALLARLVRQPLLKPASQAQLFAWLRGSQTGAARIRAGVPAAYTVGDKTGTTNTTGNDVAILWPRTSAPLVRNNDKLLVGRNDAPIVLAVYFAEVQAPDAQRDAAIADVARSVVRRLRG